MRNYTSQKHIISVKGVLYKSKIDCIIQRSLCIIVSLKDIWSQSRMYYIGQRYVIYYISQRSLRIIISVKYILYQSDIHYVSQQFVCIIISVKGPCYILYQCILCQSALNFIDFILVLIWYSDFPLFWYLGHFGGWNFWQKSSFVFLFYRNVCRWLFLIDFFVYLCTHTTHTQKTLKHKTPTHKQTLSHILVCT